MRSPNSSAMRLTIEAPLVVGGDTAGERAAEKTKLLTTEAPPVVGGDNQAYSACKRYFIVW